MKIISVVTVCRNDLNGLIETYESLNGQSYRAFEWVVIDGNSSDGTQAWLTEKHYLPGSWISEPDKGIYDAMRKGCERSCGEYVIFMNSGDTFTDAEVLKKVGTHLESKSPNLLFGDAWDVTPDGKRFSRPARSISHLQHGMPAHHQAMFFRREALNHFEFHRFRYSGDYAMACLVTHKNGNGSSKVSFAICDFLTGGAHDIHRLAAMKEDYFIRRNYLEMPVLTAMMLYLLHLIHHLAKQAFPNVIRRLRETR